MLDLLLSHERIRVAAARLARERVRERYQWPQIAKEIGEVYEELAGLGLAARDRPAIEPPAEPTDAPSKRAA
jgi:hypothetical protein